MITLTEKAILKIKEISEAEDIGHYTIRCKILGGGCSGYQYDLTFDDQISDVDEVFEQDDVKIICDPLSYQYLENSSIDYKDALIGGGFSFVAPKSTGSCGCGKSISF